MWKRFKIDWVWVFYGLLTLAIMLPLLLPGYVLTFDMSFTPHIHLPSVTSNVFPLFAVLRVLNFIIPSQIIEKLMLFAIFLLSGVGGYRLVSENLKSKGFPLGAYFAGTLYMINPFTYSRLMAGQYLVLGGYALLPWFVCSLLKFLKDPNWRTSLRLVAWTLAICIISIHSIGFMILLALAISLFHIHEFRSHKMEVLKYGGFALLIILIVSSYWLIPLIAGSSNEAKLISSVNSVNSHIYETDEGIFGLPLNVMALAGFWGDSQSRYYLPWERLSYWPAVAFVLMALVAVGMYLCIWRRDRLGMALAIAGLIAIILALGAWGPFGSLHNFLVAYLPFFKGYREPQKFVAVLVVAYAYLGGYAVSWLDCKLKKSWRIVPAVFLALPFLLSPTMVWAANGQLRSVDYPNDWYNVNRYIVSHYKGSSTLFLPWHEYLRLEFTGRVVANPAASFFDKPLITSDDPEVGSGNALSPTSQFVENVLLPNGKSGQDIAPMLFTHHIGYVMMASEADYQDYQWLNRQPALHKVYAGSELTLYEVSHGK